jgi:hypothetical protein
MRHWILVALLSSCAPSKTSASAPVNPPKAKAAVREAKRASSMHRCDNGTACLPGLRCVRNVCR